MLSENWGWIYHILRFSTESHRLEIELALPPLFDDNFSSFFSRIHHNLCSVWKRFALCTQSIKSDFHFKSYVFLSLPWISSQKDLFPKKREEGKSKRRKLFAESCIWTYQIYHSLFIYHAIHHFFSERNSIATKLYRFTVHISIIMAKFNQSDSINKTITFSDFHQTCVRRMNNLRC